MELKSFQHNGVLWRCRILGENALLLEPIITEKKLDAIHQITNVIDKKGIKEVTDIVPAYDSLALILDNELKDFDQIIEILEGLAALETETDPVLYEIPICYELGLDWKEIEVHTNLPKATIIEMHNSRKYTVAMLGFIPGFVFLDGLDPLISSPRKKVPRITVPQGSVGIGGNQTGVYSLESPGGWNIIGRTPELFFDAYEKPPSKLKSGDEILFRAISKSEFGRFDG